MLANKELRKALLRLRERQICILFSFGRTGKAVSQKPAVTYLYYMLEIDEEQEKKEIISKYRSLLRHLDNRISADDKKLIRKAFDLASDAHQGVRRKTGEPYIFHPLEVATIVAKEVGLGKVSVISALLHDVVEDSDYTLEDIERLFGEKVARIIDGLTKISGVFDQNISVQAENFRKMLLTIADDIRVILIKLADRLHNMRTMEGMPPHKQLKIASETLFIYAPLAHRLGLYNIKTELEDLSLRYTEPEVYRDIAMKLKASEAAELRYLKKFSTRIKETLKKEGFKFVIKERTKSIYSIRKKMVNQGVTFDEVYDKFAMRIILESTPEREKADCWKVYSIVTDFYRPNPDRLRDWISSPKSNGYESLHTTVMGPEGHWVEVQIRTRRMDEVAEKGYAAHWKYKEEEMVDNKLDTWINRVREMLEDPNSNALEFIDEFKFNLFSDEIFIFTPKGDLKTLPKGATPLDVAFDIHTDIGYHTLGTKVNGRLVPLNYKLRSGDQVEILTSDKQRPKEEWLNYVVTAKARNKIKSSLREEKRAIADQGKEILKRKMNFIKIRLTDAMVNEMVKFFGLRDSHDLFYKVGQGIVDNERLKEYARARSGGGIYSYLKKRFRRNAPAVPTVAEEISADSIVVFGQEEEELPYRLSKCCNPIPGDEVFGFVTSNEGIKVHRTDCPNAIALQSRLANRVIKAKWKQAGANEFVAVVNINGIDTVGLVNKVTQIISNDLNVNIRSINVSGDGGLFDGAITVVVQDKHHLNNIMNQLKKVEGIRTVERKFKER